jgi:hypothetical protein
MKKCCKQNRGNNFCSECGEAIDAFGTIPALMRYIILNITRNEKRISRLESRIESYVEGVNLWTTKEYLQDSLISARGHLKKWESFKEDLNKLLNRYSEEKENELESV